MRCQLRAPVRLIPSPTFAVPERPALLTEICASPRGLADRALATGRDVNELAREMRGSAGAPLVMHADERRALGATPAGSRASVEVAGQQP